MVSLHRQLFSPWLFLLAVGFLCLGVQAQSTSVPSDSTPLATPLASTTATTIASIVQRMGGSPPRDSLATANVTITAGSTTETGTMRIVTSGTTQTLEEINVPSGVKRKAFTQGEFFDRRKDKSKGISFEESFSAQSLLFPLPWLYANSIGDDIGIENMGVDNFAGVPVKHLRATKTFASDKTLQVFSKFTTKNIWLDPNSGLPLKIGFDSRTAGGAVAPIAIALEYSDYRSVQGYLYPFHIRKYVNGTLWADIHVQDVRFNTGVAASEFSTQ